MEDFIPYELAVKLKEKGYPQVEKNTLAMYDEDGCISYLCPTLDINRDYYIFDDFDEDDCVSPTISQVLKWLRKTHNLFIVVFLNDDSDNPVTFEIYKGTECVTDYHIKYYPLDEWSKAEIDAIEYVIDNLI